MTLSTQLRLIILAVGALLLGLIYLLGRRRTDDEEAPSPRVTSDDRTPQTFDAVSPLAIDEDAFDEPSYLRRSVRRDRVDTVAIHQINEDELPLPSVHIETAFDTPSIMLVEQEIARPIDVAIANRVPVVPMQDPDKTMPMKVDAVMPSASDVEAVNQVVTAPQPKAPVQRQLIALRLAMNESVSGEQLLAMFHAENLQHGKFNIFHRLYDGETVFSVASLVEPGSFDLESMPSQEYRGISLFLLLPSSLPAIEAFDAMMSCAERLARITGGVVQDENCVMLLESGIERLRNKALDFERA
ncbi:MAG TPA: cell division protein ZipA C-terminal FtsZ-binding domain-containing protein [Steroidobacteraceae bacterium]|nr:cell division protein ZipA C-terminal FtsZ-binding domain-containing protein [Steroidobacteraceae bacterium]